MFLPSLTGSSSLRRMSPKRFHVKSFFFSFVFFQKRSSVIKQHQRHTERERGIKLALAHYCEKGYTRPYSVIQSHLETKKKLTVYCVFVIYTHTIQISLASFSRTHTHTSTCFLSLCKLQIIYQY